MAINSSHLRTQFPILQRQVNAKPLIYFDNAATMQKPQAVIDAIVYYYTHLNANVHRGIHTLSQEATEAMEESRRKIQHFINASKEEEIIFTKSTTESINLLANGLQKIIQQGDEIIISTLEHHANIVPWQMLCERVGAVLKVIPLTVDGLLDLSEYQSLLSARTKLVACNYISNALGIINPINEIITLAKKNGSLVLIDGAQAVPHIPIDVQLLDVDFLVFSAHKMYGPTGIGILYGKYHLLDQLTPYQGGGEMIEMVTFEKTTYAKLPFRLEAGTPPIAEIIAFGTAIDWIQQIGIEHIKAQEEKLLEYAIKKLSSLDFLTIYAPNAPRTTVISFNFNLDHIHSSDVGSILDKMGIAVRTGHHCAQPVMQALGITGTIRASFAVYNTFDEIDYFYDALQKAYQMLA